MPWCPECKSEYRDGFAKCNDCGAVLADKFEKSSREKDVAMLGKPLKKEQSKTDKLNEVFLINTDDAVELSYITSMLEKEKIVYRIIAGDAGLHMQIIHGRSFFGKKILVDREDYDKAIAVLQSLEEIQPDKQIKIKDRKSSIKISIKIIIWVYLAIPFLSLFVIIIMNLLYYF